MPSDYSSIRSENERRYGTDIGRIGTLLLAGRYDNRTHFIYELLQNAEDALARRNGWSGPRAVVFRLSETDLRISHFGIPFSEPDVRGICGIAESTKELTAIGHFGIGFKSVYAFTGRPEVHSGDEHFAIDSFVWPRAIPPIESAAGETVFILPLSAADASAVAEIGAGLRKLGPRTLLFLREIQEISWSVGGGASGSFLRGDPETICKNARKVVVMGQEHGAADIVEETWLVFSREVQTEHGRKAGYIEVAFQVTERVGASQGVTPIHDSTLVVFFPTIVPTNLGFLAQGPYRTTPSRDNVPRNNAWNQHLVQETATLLVEALREMRGLGLLDAAALNCLPLDRAQFGEGSMFAPLFDVVCKSLCAEALLPRFGGGHIRAPGAKLARTRELRQLFSPAQLTSILQADQDIAWLSDEISQDRTPELRRYLMRELGVAEVAPETILSVLTKPFLEAQSDEWIVRLYEFLNGQPALLQQGRLDELPLVRLEDGSHVVAQSNGQPQAFLPSAVKTDFPTVRRAVCATDNARKFLEALNLKEPDPVDDVVRNVLLKYSGEGVDLDDEEYATDIRKMVTAFGTDSKTLRDKLLAALRETNFIKSLSTEDGTKHWAAPGSVYLATERLKELFAGVPGVLLVDDSNACLRGEEVREFLEACGASRHLQSVPVRADFTWEEKRKMRRAAGNENSTYESINDQMLRGVDSLLAVLPKCGAETRRKKAALLWEALGDVGESAFSGSYRWSYYRNSHSAEFDAAFVRQLEATAWVPNEEGEIEKPEFVVFDTIGWTANPFLLSKIRFKPPDIETLAKKAGIEPGLLDLLKKLGVTSEAQLRVRLGLENTPETPGPTALVDSGPEAKGSGVDESDNSTASGGGSHKDSSGNSQADAQSHGRGTAKRTPGSKGGQPFISYVGVHPDDEEPDPDSLDKQQRNDLEDKAIALILESEPGLIRMPHDNPGFDLFEPGPDREPTRWIEVKAMTGGLCDRPVGLSHTQFKCAEKHGEDFWLYVVEHAASPEEARIVRIQNPAGKARTFTFDHGWLDVAAISDPPSEPSTVAPE